MLNGDTGKMMQKYNPIKMMIKKSTPLFWSILLMPLFFSCNKEFNNRLDIDDNADTTVHRAKDLTKVLYIIVDEAVGKTMIEQSQKDDLYPNLHAITKTSLFTGNAVSSKSNDLATTYADMLTGVTEDKHQVTGGGANNLDDYPMFFSSLKHENQSWRTAAFTTSSFLHDELIKDADVNLLLQTDMEVKEATIEELKKPEASVVLAQFNGIKEAGNLHGFGPNVPEYLAAIKEFDTYLGDLITTYRARENYKSEKWLIVIASNKGGAYSLLSGEDDGSAFSDTERNSFVLFSNDRFALQYVQADNYKNLSYEGYAIRMNSANNATIPSELADVYNIGTSGDYTIQLRIKSHNKGTLNPAIISKQNNTGNADDGWAFIHNGGIGWRFKIKGDQFSSNTKLELEKWTTLTAKVFMDGATRKVSMFTNGVLEHTNTITGQGSSTAPLRLGYSSSYQGGSVEQTVTDVRIYKTALPDAYIQNNYCSTIVRKDDVYYNDLIGYWPAIESNTRGTLEDLSKNKRDFILSNNDAWTSFSETDDNLCPTIPDDIEKTVPATVDIPLFIYRWMGVKNISNLALDGKVWVPTYLRN